ncbi:fasciclin-like arabinogalactan protein 12 [Malania oleifera]|uniref:fasciclin-like arabinogalactan protein 12 n=1 Tax=Malania oleifera TaxID=397392 RepID=UPI0025AE031F|nr:fasciclin-like arabinogalactan protein 12 [Malania oleifera]
MKNLLISSSPLPAALVTIITCLTLLLHHSQASSLATSTSSKTNIVEILQKAGHFGSLLRLLKATQMDTRINSEVRKSNQGLTIFAPSDAGFSGLKSGTLNTLSNEQQVQLVQFHVLTSYLSPSQFQTATNPLHTQAGSSDDGQFPLNITTDGGQVNVTSGVVNTTVANTVFNDGHLAVYQVDQVLLPQVIFAPAPPAPAPAPAKHKKKAKASPPPAALLAAPPPESASSTTPAVSSDKPSADASGAEAGLVLVRRSLVGVWGAAVVVVAAFWL